MTDVTVENEQANVKVVKSYTIPLKGGAGFVTLANSDELPDEMFVYVIQRGLETIVNESGGMPKLLKGITKLEENEQSKVKAEVRKLANENIQALLDGSLKLKGAKSAVKVSGAVEKEALRLARDIVKDSLRKNGYKQSALSAKEHTAAAKEVLVDNPDLYAKAEANLKEREDGAKTTAPIDLKKMFGAKLDDPNAKAKPKGENLKKANAAKAKGEQTATDGVRAKPKQETAEGKGKAEAKVQPKVAPRATAKPEHHTAH